MKIQHLHLHVRERSSSERFYERWLGLRVASHGERLTFMEDAAGFSRFHFGSRLESAEQLERMHEAMARASIPIARPLHRDETLASFRCADPDGYAIEIYWEA